MATRAGKRAKTQAALPVGEEPVRAVAEHGSKLIGLFDSLELASRTGCVLNPAPS